MALLPMLFSNWWEDLERPHRLLDQNFGLGIHPEHIVTPRSLQLYGAPWRSEFSRCPVATGYVRPWSELLRQGEGGSSIVKADKDKFQVSLDVQQFAPEEVSVKVVDRSVVVEGKHEEKQDEHGWISRQFVRKYLIPEQCDIEQVSSKLSSDGVLSIVVPRKDKPPVEGERVISIEHTGQPALREKETEKTKAEEEEK
ncbi:protein lethal(2)essential for life [Orussus abietinus]|uniref:protein lethal(2)essential for life n=1 Tax=Orussus abietinus TaxID=222816 RepID=UPI0006264142|nr:protein lethal(2)essential for life [Orussus abietinus]